MDRILQRRDTAANWSTTNPILAEGEIGIITDGAKGYKIGDGVTAWNNLEYPANPTSVVGELGDSEVAVINLKCASDSLVLLTFNSTSKITLSEIKISQCITNIQLRDFDTLNESEEWKLLLFGVISSSDTTVFYFLRISDSKLVECEPSGSRDGIVNYDTFVNNLHIDLTFDWNKYNDLFPSIHYYPSDNNYLCIDVKKGTDNAITNKGFYITSGNIIRNDNIYISECFHNFKLYDYNFDNSGYEFYQLGWLPSVNHPIFYYKKIGTDDVILFDDTSISVEPTGTKHHLYDNGVIRVEFDFDWDLFFKYFPTDCYRRREANFLTVNAIDFEYVSRVNKVIPSIDTLIIKLETEYDTVTEFFRNKYVFYNSPVLNSSIVNTMTIGVSRTGWTTTPELVKLNLIIGTIDLRNTLVNPRIYTFSLSELNIKYPSSLYVTIDLSDKNIVIDKGEVIGVLSGSLATNDFIFLVSRGTDLSDDTYISSTIDGIFSNSYEFVKFEVTLDNIDSVFALLNSVDTLLTEVNTVSKTLSYVSANILTDTVTGVKYKLLVSNGVLNVKTIDYNNILVIGTSLVNPEPASTYGWYVNRTMAASVYGHATADYLLRAILKRNTDATLHLMNDYLWQRNYDDFDYSQYDSTITTANPDVIYLITGGNSTYTSTFKEAFGQYLTYLKTIAPNADIYVLVGWYGATKASDMIEECIQYNVVYVNISANRNIYNTWTVGDYYLGDDIDTYYPITNTSVGSHPNDMGHYNNAEALLEASMQSSNEDLIHNITLNTVGVTAQVVNDKWVLDGIMTIRILSGTVTSINVEDANNNIITATLRTNDNNTSYDTYYTFVMPDSDVTITIN